MAIVQRDLVPQEPQHGALNALIQAPRGRTAATGVDEAPWPQRSIPALVPQELAATQTRAAHPLTHCDPTLMCFANSDQTDCFLDPHE